jgi:hypothetical protein
MNYIVDAKLLAKKIDDHGKPALSDSIINAYETDFGKKDLMLLMGYAYHYAKQVDAYSAFNEDFRALADDHVALSAKISSSLNSYSIKKSRDAVADLIESDIDSFDSAIILCSALDSLDTKAQSILLRSVETHKNHVLEIDLDTIRVDDFAVYADAFENDSEAIEFISKKVEQLKGLMSGRVELYTTVGQFDPENIQRELKKVLSNNYWSLTKPVTGENCLKCSVAHQDIDLSASIIASGISGNIDALKLSANASRSLKAESYFDSEGTSLQLGRERKSEELLM